jgi:hypothetical protein
LHHHVEARWHAVATPKEGLSPPHRWDARSYLHDHYDHPRRRSTIGNRRGRRLRPRSRPPMARGGEGGGQGRANRARPPMWPPRDDCLHRSGHCAPLSSPCLDDSSPRPGRPPREEWTRAMLLPSLPALWVVPSINSGGDMARMRRWGDDGVRIGVALGCDTGEAFLKMYNGA